MEFLLEIAANLFLLLGIFLIRWCRVHKQATLAILIILLMIVDVVFILWRFAIIQI